MRVSILLAMFYRVTTGDCDRCSGRVCRGHESDRLLASPESSKLTVSVRTSGSSLACSLTHSQCSHIDVVKVPSVETHVLNLAFQGLNNSVSEVDPLKHTSAAKSAGAEHIDLHQLAANDVQADEEHPIFDQFRTHYLSNVERYVVNDRLGFLAPCVDVAADIIV